MKSYILANLDCANCAAKIEAALRKSPKVSFASINFVTKTLTLDASDLGEVKRIITRIEDGVTISENGPSNEEVYHIKLEIALFAIAFASFGLGWGLEKGWISGLALRPEIFYIGGWFIAGWQVLLRAVKNIFHAQIFDENFLMTVSTVGAFAIGASSEAAAVMLFFKVGDFFQEHAVNHSRRSIKSLLSIRPEYANVIRNNAVVRVHPDELSPGDLIVVRAGERVPVDGEVIEGNSWIDASALTGESMPRGVAVGDKVLSGSINTGKALTMRVDRRYAESSVARILSLVEDASLRKAKTEKFITTFARYYTPAVVALALLVAIIPPILTGAPFSDWVYRALVLLVISCPCALVVSIPLGYFGGIGGASRKGILVKGSAVLDALAKVEMVVFDKTGTLTNGKFTVREIVPSNGFSPDEILIYAAEAELHSNHPIAVSMREASGTRINADEVSDHEEISGYGVIAHVRGKRIVVGNDRILHREGIDHHICCVNGTVAHVAVDGTYAGYVIVADEAKADARSAVDSLHAAGVSVAMITGDSLESAAYVGETIGIDELYTDLLPEGKVDALERVMRSQKGKVAFVGDGINDAPVIARADVGVAMGQFGSAAAVESADLVLMTDSPSKLPAAIHHAKRTRTIVMQNIIFALGIKAVFATLGIIGVATMWEAVFADMGVTLIAIANAMRALRS
ncbi:MAG TPA: heavy metal translocating P-type ATPase [Spirochaetota bacterium]